MGQRYYVLLSGLSVGCLYFIALILALTSGFLTILVGSFLPRMLTLLVYLIGWGVTWPRVSELGWPLEPLFMCSSIVLGGLMGHTWSHTRRIVHLAAQLEVRALSKG